MKPTGLRALAEKGQLETYPKDEVFHSLDFSEKLYLIKSGYVKRYAVVEEKIRSIESIYGPDYFFPLTPVFSAITDLKLSQDNMTYLYQAMSDVEVKGINVEGLVAAVKKDPKLYGDILYESGRRLRSNIHRLSNNALGDNHQKVAHELAFVASEFGSPGTFKGRRMIKILLPLTNRNIAELLNIPASNARNALLKLKDQGLVLTEAECLYIPDMNLLQDAYL